MPKVYEVVCTKCYDVGLLIEKYKDGTPKTVMAAYPKYNKDGKPSYYGGVPTVEWLRTGILLTETGWEELSYGKNTMDIINELNIKDMIEAKKYSTAFSIEKSNNTNIPVTPDYSSLMDDMAFQKKYNVEWCLNSGVVNTTSAVMTGMKDGFFFFKYPSGGVLIVKKEAIRSLECLE